MRLKQRAVWGIGSAVAVAVATGCSGLLGDFTLGAAGSGDAGPASDGSPSVDGTVPGSDGGDGGSSLQDGPGADGPVTDAGEDASFVLACAPALTNPLQIDSLESSSVHFYSSTPLVMSVSEQMVQVVMRGEGGQYTFFWVDPKNPNDPVQGAYSVPLGNGAAIGAGRVSAGSVVVEDFKSPPLYTGNQLSLTLFPDSLLPGNAPSTSLALSPKLPTMSNFAAAFAESDPNDFVWATSGQVGGADASTVYGGRAYPDGGLVYANLYSTPMTGGTPVVLHDSSTIRVYLSSSPNQGGTLAYRFADDAIGPDGGGNPRVLDPDGGLPSLIAGAVEADGGPNFAFVDIDTSSGIAATYRVGQVPSANLDTFQATDIPAALVVSQGRELPITSGFSGWFGDQFVMVGLGNPIAANGGINFLWFDAQGQLRGNKRGVDALFTGHTTIDGVGISLASALGSLVTWNLVWSEQVTDADGSIYDALYLDQITCD